ncbi:MAG: cyclase family protein [Pirellulales bacterium]
MTSLLPRNLRQLAAGIGILFSTAGCERPSHPAAQVQGIVNPLAGVPIDLTHTFDADTIYWPTEKGFQFERGNNGPTAKGYYYAANRFTTAEHGGTHLDAPIHFAEGRQTSDIIRLDRLVGEAAVIDVTQACDRNTDYQVSVADLHAWEERHQRQLVDVILLLRTGWSSRWPDRGRYLGTTKLGPEAVVELRFPGLAPEAARWLTEHRGVKAVGIDTASIDYGRSTHFETHVQLCKHGMPVFENVADMSGAPGARGLGRRAADEDRRRQRRTATHRCFLAGSRRRSSLNRRLQTETEQMFASSHVDTARGDRRRADDRSADIVLAENVELRAVSENDDVAVLAGDVNLAVARNR